ncbi:MAG TPA: pentapeptide repeat-containing protein [Gemmataceae bacterium]|nr:pentapeptide repeat-containing protein [Gemmataceae bacterium]
MVRLVELHTQGRLELPAHDGIRATLDGIDLGRERFQKLEGAGNTSPRCWNTEHQAVDLRRANLRGASLRHANLHGALLEEAILAGADLASTNLQGADLAGADLQGALLEDADLRKAVLRFAKGRGSVLEEARLQGADLWGADMEGADLRGADLQGATLEEANFQGTDLGGADLRGANLKRANLKGANLRGADLRGAALGGTNLEGAVLRDAKVQELELTDCALTHAHTCGARLEKTRLDQEQLGGAIGEEVTGEYGLAQRGYLALQRNFNELGDHDAARWAYRRRRRMEKGEAWQKARAAWAERRWGAVARCTLKYACDQLVEWTCDYGESVSRVLGTLVAVYVLFVLLYGLTGTVLRAEKGSAGEIKTPTYDPANLALFSLASMTSPGNPPDYLQPRNEFAYLLAGVQTLLSIFLTGLMGFVAGNRIRR